MHGDDAAGETQVLLSEYEQFLSVKARGTIDAYLRTVRQLIAWLASRPGSAGRFEPQQLTVEAVEQYLAHLEREGFSLHHRARVRSSISNFAQFLIEEKGLLRRNPTRSVELPPLPALALQTLTQEQRDILRVLVEQEGNRRGAALFALAYWAGCRVSELSRLQMTNTHVDHVAGWLRVGHDGKGWRDIDLMDEARRPLYAYLQATRSIQRTYVFISQRSERLTEEAIHFWFRALKAQAANGQREVIQGITFNDLRRDFASRARAADWSLEEVTYYLGDVAKGASALQTTIQNVEVSRKGVWQKLENVKG